MEWEGFTDCTAAHHLVTIEKLIATLGGSQVIQFYIVASVIDHLFMKD